MGKRERYCPRFGALSVLGWWVGRTLPEFRGELAAAGSDRVRVLRRRQTVEAWCGSES